MKKIQFFLLAALAICFAACNPNTPEPKVKFDIKVSNITETSADIYCAAQPADAAFSVFVLEKSEWDAATDKNALFQESIDKYIEIYEEYKDDFAAEGINSVEQLLVEYLLYQNEVAEGSVSGLTPNSEYVVAAVGVDMTTYKTIETPTVVEFKTLEYVPVEVSFTINVTDVTPMSASITVVPSNDNAYYYWDVFDAESLAANGGANGAMQSALDQMAEIMDLYAQFGYEMTWADVLSQGPDEYDYELSPATEYTVIAAAVNALTGEIIGQVATQTFTTSAYTMPENTSITISVTDITATTANITCTPADQALNYFFDVLPKENFEALTDPIMARLQMYYEAYQGSYTMDEIINGLMSTGTDSYDYEGFDPATTYVVFAKAYNHNEKAYTGELCTAEFTTAEGGASVDLAPIKKVAVKKNAPTKVGKTVKAGNREITIQKIKSLKAN